MTSAVVRRFNAAFGRQDVDAVMALSTDDTVLETTPGMMTPGCTVDRAPCMADCVAPGRATAVHGGPSWRRGRPQRDEASSWGLNRRAR